MAWLAVDGPALCLASVTALPVWKLLAAVLGLSAGLYGVALLVATSCGYPRLRVGAEGLVMEDLFGRTVAEWGELGPFQLQEAPGSSCWAISTASDNASLRRQRRVVLRPVYAKPLVDVVGAVNRRMAFASMATRAEAHSLPWRLPWLSAGLLAILAGVYALELRWPATAPSAPDQPSTATVLAFGAMSGVRVLNAHEAYRLLTAVMLHASAGHLAANAIALLVGGWSLEAVLGSAWFLVALCAGGLSGSLLDLAAARFDAISLGASGAVVGLFVTGLMASLRLPASVHGRGSLQWRLLWMLVPTLLPVLLGQADPAVDNTGHFGGALGGGLVGLALWRWWPPGDRLPLRRWPVAWMAGLACATYLVAAAAGAMAWTASPFRGLAPSMPATEVQAAAQRYPDDPRVMERLARQSFNARDYAAAAHGYAAAIRLVEAIRPLYGQSYRSALERRLALALWYAGRRDEAAATAVRGCASIPPDDADVLQDLQHLGLCADSD